MQLAFIIIMILLVKERMERIRVEDNMSNILQEELDEYLISKGAFIAYKNISPNDPNYAEIRMGGFGASDAAALLDVSKYSTKSQMIQDKIEKNTHPEIGEKPAVRKGKELEEPIIIPKAERDFGTTIIKPAHMYGLHNGLRVNFDGVMKVNNKYIPVEIKFCTYWGAKNYNFKRSGVIDEYIEPKRQTTYIKEDIIKRADFYGVPVNYYCQLQQQMLFLDADYGYIAVLNDTDWEMYYFYIPKDTALIALLNRNAAMEYKLLRIRRGEKVEVDANDI